MQQLCLIASALIALLAALSATGLAEQTQFDYPCYLVDAYDPENDGWQGMAIDGHWQVSVDPQKWLIGPPPSNVSGVTMPPDHWVELQFRGPIVDGPGPDIHLIELGRAGEQALVFLTDGAGREYLLDVAIASDAGGHFPTNIDIDISRASLPFEARAIRLVGLDKGGLCPGFDIANMRARIRLGCGPYACNPVPVDGAKNVALDAVLTWLPGSSAEKHIVYFGTSLDAVDANAVPVADPLQPQVQNSFDPPSLKLGETYYWRIDEVSSADTNSPWPGSIWSFTAVDHLVLEDFESYSTLNDNWVALGGASMYLSTNTEVVYKGDSSMALTYHHAPPFYSQAVRTFTTGQDWSAVGGKAVDLFFRGEPYNDPNARMFFALGNQDANAVIPYDGSALDITRRTWQPWRIDLSSLGDVDLSNIEYIVIGFTDDGAPGPSGTGFSTVYFDNITLYPTRCLTHNKPNADLTGDCAVSFPDLEEMAYTWLDRTPKRYPHKPPQAPPLAWYKFDGDAGDSSGNNYHGTLTGDANAAYDDPLRGFVLALDGRGDAVDITNAGSLFAKIRSAITITFWQRGTDSAHHTDTLCCSNYIYGLRDPAIAVNLGVWRRPGRYNWDCGHPFFFDKTRLSSDHRYDSQWTNRWNHWAFTKDTQAGTDPNTGTMNIYLNGVLYDTRTDANSPISGISSFRIGSGWYGGYDGLIDDFHIYGYALSLPEIVHVATEGTGLFDLPLMLGADLSGDNRINFTDYAILAAQWLDEHLWP